ncbi:MAG: DUF3037 domain-containing protein [Rubrobacteraceae bacterium]
MKLFEYALLRVVPRVEREEFVNAGVVLHCREANFLDARIHLDRDRLLALAPTADYEAILAHLNTVSLVCAGGPEAGVIGSLPAGQRFGWLVAPRSTVVQASPIHTGYAKDPDEALDRLLKNMVQ